VIERVNALNRALRKIEEFPDLSELQRDTVIEIAGLVSRMYLEQDASNYEVLGVEQDFVYHDLTRGRADLVLRVREEPVSGFLRPYRGGLVVLDWKTSAGNLDTRWRRRYSMSWQWKIYSVALGARLFLYRGISTKYQPEDGTYEVKEFGLEVPDWIHEYVREELALAKAQVSSYRGFSRWPRTMDNYACYAFGDECPFIEHCRAGISVFDGEYPYNEPLSYSKLNLLHLCPDRMRMTYFREQLGLDDEPDEFESRYLGQAVHEVLAEMYRTYFKLTE
jgi:hypothetical protein